MAETRWNDHPLRRHRMAGAGAASRGIRGGAVPRPSVRPRPVVARAVHRRRSGLAAGGRPTRGPLQRAAAIVDDRLRDDERGRRSHAVRSGADLSVEPRRRQRRRRLVLGGDARRRRALERSRRRTHSLGAIVLSDLQRARDPVRRRAADRLSQRAVGRARISAYLGVTRRRRTARGPRHAQNRPIGAAVADLSAAERAPFTSAMTRATQEARMPLPEALDEMAKAASNVMRTLNWTTPTGGSLTVI